VWLLAGTLLTVPLAVAPSLEAFDVTPKLLALLAGACTVWLALALEGKRPQGPRLFFAALVVLALCGVVSAIFSADRVLSLAGSEWRRMGLPAWLACLALAAAIPAAVGDDPRRRGMLLQAIAASGTVAAVYSFAQYAGHDPWINPALYHIGEGEWRIVRPPATFGYVSYFALYEASAIFVAASLALSATSRTIKIAWSSAAAAMAIAVIVSGSRGALLGAAAGVLAMTLRQSGESKALALNCAGDGRTRRAVLAGTLVVAALAGAFIASPLGQPVRSRMRWFVEDPEGGGRLMIWRDSAKLAAAHPLLGAGLETFGREFAPVESLELARRFPDRYVESPHNIFLDYSTAAGVPTLAAFGMLMIVALRSTWCNPDPALFAALFAGLVAAQFVADTITTRLLLMSLAALVLPMAPGPSGASGFDSRPDRANRTARWMVGLCAVLAAFALIVLGGRLVSADRAAFQAQAALSRGDLDTAVQAGRVSAEAFPWGGAYAFRQSRLLGQVAMIPSLSGAARGFLLLQAEALAREALPHAEQPGAIYLQLASVAGIQGRYQEAQSELEAAVGASPAWFRPRWQLAVLLWQQGRKAEAAQQAGFALERGARALPEAAAQCVRIQTLARSPQPSQP
jgi:putative inorganic carbon (HCO3(-)) transporter